MIESSTNGQVKKIKKLKKNARFRREQKLFAIEGWKMVQEAVKHSLARDIYVSEEAWEQWQEKSFPSNMPVQVLSSGLFQDLSDTVSPQGVLALVEMPYYTLEEISAGQAASLLILENIQDPGNLGTMMRTAEGAGMSGVLLGKGCVDIYNPKAVRATMGSLFRVPFLYSDELTTDVELLKTKGFTIYAAHLAGEREYSQETYEGRTGILIGNEANGLSDEISARADRLVKISMEGELESLNAAVCAALLMYEVRRNRTLPIA